MTILGPVEMRPGQNYVVMIEPLRNISGEPLTVLDAEVVGTDDVELEGIPEVARVVRIALAPRGFGRPTPSLGEYLTFPPVFLSDGRCAVQEVHDVSGFVVEPVSRSEEAVVLLMWLEAISPGRAQFGGERVTYEQEGRVFQQVSPSAIRVVVTPDAKAPRPYPEERRCRHLAESVFF